jgi:hypothetical protein
MSPLSLRNAVVVTRIIAGLLAGVSLALFAIVIDKVFNFEFSVAVKPWISTLPAFAVSDIFQAISPFTYYVEQGLT